MSMLNRNKLVLKTKVSTRLRHTYLIASGSAFALAVLFGLSVFFYGNIGAPTESKASGITLLNFTATLVNNSSQVNIQWITKDEVNNALFDLQRSTNAFDYELISEMPGKGTDSATNQYSFVDTHPLTGVSYYRLKQVNEDGTFSYGAIQSIDIEQRDTSHVSPPPPAAPPKGSDSTNIKLTNPKSNNAVMRQVNIYTPEKNVVLAAKNNPLVLAEESILKVFPNPAIREVNVAINVSKAIDTHIDIVDLTGRLIFTQPISLNNGLNEVTLPLTDLPKGIYVVSFVDENNKAIIQKFMKQ
jgi:hypothetical protein